MSALAELVKKPDPNPQLNVIQEFIQSVGLSQAGVISGRVSKVNAFPGPRHLDKDLPMSTRSQ